MEKTGISRFELDNAAILFPAITTKKDPHIYRVSVIMAQEVNKAILQQALEETLPRFPAFCVRLKNGWNWHYFEPNPKKPIVYTETDEICTYLDISENQDFLFRVLYYGNRIHLESSHVLTDGTGAVYFLLAVCYRYCQLAFSGDFSPESIEARHGLALAEKVEDGYKANYRKSKQKGFGGAKAARLKGNLREDGKISVLTALMPIDEIKKISQSYNVTVGEYLSATIIKSIFNENLIGEKNVGLFVPVNLRPVFETETIRNFFSSILINISHEMKDEPFEKILEEIKYQYRIKKTKDAMIEKIAYTVGGEKHFLAKYVPLLLKNYFLKFMYNFTGRDNTLTFSNLGSVVVEEPFAKYIEGFRALLPTSAREPLKITAYSYKGELAISFVTRFGDSALANGFVKQLRDLGVPVDLEVK